MTDFLDENHRALHTFGMQKTCRGSMIFLIAAPLEVSAVILADPS